MSRNVPHASGARRRTHIAVWTTALGLLLAPSMTFAHHSFAMYDPAKLITLTGTVKDFEWTNPHSRVWLITGGMDGKPEDLWSLELPTSPGNLTRMGWTKRSLKAGDHVAIDINPLRDGRHGGSLKKVTVLSTGQVLTTAGAGGAPTASK